MYLHLALAVAHKTDLDLCKMHTAAPQYHSSAGLHVA